MAYVKIFYMKWQWESMLMGNPEEAIANFLVLTI